MSGLLPTFLLYGGCVVQRTREENIRQLAEPLIEAEGMELIYAECLKMKSRWVVRIFLDKEGGVTLDDCAAISNQLGDILDVHDVPPGPYTLEVSSPGIERPLERDKDFLKYRGSPVFIRADEKIDGIRNFRGKLVDLIDENGKKTVIVDVAGALCRIPKDKMVKAHLTCEF
jgi:ribosome maturation factor RimP